MLIRSPLPLLATWMILKADQRGLCTPVLRSSHLQHWILVSLESLKLKNERCFPQTVSSFLPLCSLLLTFPGWNHLFSVGCGVFSLSTRRVELSSMEFIRSLHTVRSSEACGWNVSMPLRWMLNLNSGSGNFFACELQEGRRSWGHRLCVSWKHVGQISSGENISHHRVGEGKLWMSHGNFCTPQDWTLNIPVLQDDPGFWALPVTMVVPDILMLAWLSCYLGCNHFPPWELWLIMMGTLSPDDGDAVSKVWNQGDSPHIGPGVDTALVLM